MTDTRKKVMILGRVTDEQQRRLDTYLKAKGITRSEWVRTKIDNIRGAKG